MREVSQPADIARPDPPAPGPVYMPEPPGQKPLGVGDSCYVESQQASGLVSVAGKIVGAELAPGRCAKCGSQTKRELILEPTRAISYCERCTQARCKSEGIAEVRTADQAAALVAEAGDLLRFLVVTLAGGPRNVCTFQRGQIRRLPGFLTQG
jgi:predicted Zn-ribbon and HTH transcriptional regulator